MHNVTNLRVYSLRCCHNNCLKKTFDIRIKIILSKLQLNLIRTLICLHYENRISHLLESILFCYRDEFTWNSRQ